MIIKIIECCEQSISKSVHKINNNIKFMVSYLPPLFRAVVLSHYASNDWSPERGYELGKFLTSLKKGS